MSIVSIQRIAELLDVAQVMGLSFEEAVRKVAADLCLPESEVLDAAQRFEEQTA